jgi:hypothetical protein
MKHMNTNMLTDQQAEVIKNHASLTAYALAHGAPAYACDIQPGNGTRYMVVVTAMKHTAGNTSYVEGSHVLSLPYFRTSYPTSFTGYTTADYAAEKWTGRNIADGEVIATYLNEVARGLAAAATTDGDDY